MSVQENRGYVPEEEHGAGELLSPEPLCASALDRTSQLGALDPGLLLAVKRAVLLASMKSALSEEFADESMLEPHEQTDTSCGAGRIVQAPCERSFRARRGS